MEWMQYRKHEHVWMWRVWRCVWCGTVPVRAALVVIIAAGYFPALALASSTPATYAEYVDSKPAMNALLPQPPTTIAVHFSTRVDIQHSTLAVLDVSGRRVDTGPTRIDKADPATLVIDMQGDQSELYIVNWHTMSAQGSYRDGGSFRFFVHISPVLKNTLTSTPSRPSAPTIAPRPDRIGVPLWITGLIGLLGLLVGAGVMWSFSQQEGYRRSIALIPPSEDE
ncbi:copper resistance CopC family protein [Dictyobacter aurantiacus]|uniref:CopC domain-containing protein n=1 Tax=Dictyobacter aurantiacus TaxID=1936993 RepID=A0A401ZPN1_9CHLR|nr:copper resistance protein CopC [Dictyobacter aurantiacus]GCE08792.1 hypothetical protein KDAU_61210 [Dictyobacter aurantiacus]